MFLHKYIPENSVFAYKSKNQKSNIIIFANTYNCCYTCYYFNVIDFITKLGKPCEGYPDDLPVNNDFTQIYICDKYKGVKRKNINL